MSLQDSVEATENGIDNRNSTTTFSYIIKEKNNTIFNFPTGMSIYLSSISNSKHLRFYFLVAGILVSFGLHNYMQELIMLQPGFAIGVILGYLEVLGMTICSFLEIVITVSFSRLLHFFSLTFFSSFC